MRPRMPAACGSTCWYQPCPHSAPSREQLISMRRSRTADSPCRTPVIISTSPSSSAICASRAAIIGSTLICRVHHLKVLLFGGGMRSEEHTSELQSLMRTSYAVFCLKNKNNEELSHT